MCRERGLRHEVARRADDLPDINWDKPVEEEDHQPFSFEDAKPKKKKRKKRKRRRSGQI